MTNVLPTRVATLSRTSRPSTNSELAVDLLFSRGTMIGVDEAAVIEGVRQFLKLHATCGHAAVDTPELPGGAGYRVIAACRCGETTEYWLRAALFPQTLLAAALADPPGPPRPRSRKAA